MHFAQWSNDRSIRAEIVRWLCVDRDVHKAMDPRGINVRGARIVGLVDLGFVSVPVPLTLVECAMPEGINLAEAQTRRIDLNGTLVGSIIGYRLVTHGDVRLGLGFSAIGRVLLPNVTVNGQVLCRGGAFLNGDGIALDMTAASVTGDVFLDEGFMAQGEVVLTDAIITGQVELGTSLFINPRRCALKADGLRVHGNLCLNEGFRALGEVRMLGAVIGGQIDCRGGRFLNRNGTALNADGIVAQRGLFMDHGFRAIGSVRISGATMGGIRCTGGRIRNRHGVALSTHGSTIKGDALFGDGFRALGEVEMSNTRVTDGSLICNGEMLNKGRVALRADDINVGGDIRFGEGYRAWGEVRLLRARVNGELFCAGRLLNRGAIALQADHMSVDGSVVLSDGGRAFGEVRLSGAAIGGQLACRGAVLRNAGQHALSSEGATISSDVILDQGFRTNGLISLSSTTIGGSVSFAGAKFTGTRASGLMAEYITVKRSVEWRLEASSAATRLLLDHARIDDWVDDRKSWPKQGQLHLDGFAYNSISPDDLMTRLEWIELQDPRQFRLQPYEQLSEVLRRTGHTADAVVVAIRKEQARVKHGGLNAWGRLWQRFIGITIGYGYRPGRAAIWGLLIVMLGTCLFSWGYKNRLFAPTKDKDTLQPFGALAYSFDAFLPIINVHQEEYWLPDANIQVAQAPHWATGMGFVGEGISYNCRVGCGRLLRYYFWFHVAAGWLLTTLFVAALSGVVRRAN